MVGHAGLRLFTLAVFATVLGSTTPALADPATHEARLVSKQTHPCTDVGRDARARKSCEPACLVKAKSTRLASTPFGEHLTLSLTFKDPLRRNEARTITEVLYFDLDDTGRAVQTFHVPGLRCDELAAVSVRAECDGSAVPLGPPRCKSFVKYRLRGFSGIGVSDSVVFAD